MKFMPLERELQKLFDTCDISHVTSTIATRKTTVDTAVK
jgi:hypothetical protein